MVPAFSKSSPSLSYYWKIVNYDAKPQALADSLLRQWPALHGVRNPGRDRRKPTSIHRSLSDAVFHGELVRYCAVTVTSLLMSAVVVKLRLANHHFFCHLQTQPCVRHCSKCFKWCIITPGINENKSKCFPMTLREKKNVCYVSYKELNKHIALLVKYRLSQTKHVEHE